MLIVLLQHGHNFGLPNSFFSLSYSTYVVLLLFFAFYIFFNLYPTFTAFAWTLAFFNDAGNSYFLAIFFYYSFIKFYYTTIWDNSSAYLLDVRFF